MQSIIQFIKQLISRIFEFVPRVKQVPPTHSALLCPIKLSIYNIPNG